MSKEQISESFGNEFDLTFGQQPLDMGLETRVLDPDSISAQLPPLAFVAKAEYSRDGQDLIVKISDENGGQSVIIKNYFASANPPTLKTMDGAVISPQMVNSFMQNNGSEQYYAQGILDKLLAQSGKKTVEGTVAIVESTEGNALVIRNGKAITLEQHDVLIQGDVISTAKGEKLDIVFADGTNFQLGGEARISIDEFSFDEVSSKGLQVLSILYGAFSYASGLVAKDDPANVTLRTPIGEIGIRGTKVVGDINEEDASASITILEGRVIYQNLQGQQFELDQGFETLRISNGGDKVRETTISPDRAAKDYEVFNSIEEVNDFLQQPSQSGSEARSSDATSGAGSAGSAQSITYSDAVALQDAREFAESGLDNLELLDAATDLLLVLSEAGERLFGDSDIAIVNIGGSDNRKTNPYDPNVADESNSLYVVDLGRENGKIQVLLHEDNLAWLIDSGGRAITVTFHKFDLSYSGTGTLFITDGNNQDSQFQPSQIAASTNFKTTTGEAAGATGDDLLIVISAGSDTYHIAANDYFSGVTADSNDLSTLFGFSIAAARDSTTINFVQDNSIAAT